MLNETFKKIVEERIISIRKTLSIKGEEYASEEDRLHNFKKAALITGCKAEEALIGMQAKHIVSILDLIDIIANLNEEEEEIDVSKEYIFEKIGDTINYFILLEALLYERLS